METQNRLLTIQQASKVTGLTVHTLRYYERIGLLLEPVGRAANGHRRYSASNLEVINMLNRWRLTGMPLADIQRYAQLYRDGDTTIAERRAMLEAHRQRVVNLINDLQETLGYIDFKIKKYDEMEETSNQN